MEGTCLPNNLLAIIFALGHMVKKVFLKDLNEFYLNLMFTSESSKKNVGFLDLKVKLKQGKIERICMLNLRPDNYFHYTSSHPEHTKRSTVFSQSLRVGRICFREEDFRKHATEMRLFIKGAVLKI